MISAMRGIVSFEKHKFSHIGFYFSKNKKAYETCMDIIENAQWDTKIPKKDRYETFSIDKEID